MGKTLLSLLYLILLTTACLAPKHMVSIPNGDFEQGLDGWSIHEKKYKIYPHKKHKLTAADVVAPDGLVYPDWRFAGVQGGIPEVPVKARVDNFGAKANDEKDDAAALEDAIVIVGRAGGGAVLLPGNYHAAGGCTLGKRQCGKLDNLSGCGLSPGPYGKASTLMA